MSKLAANVLPELESADIKRLRIKWLLAVDHKVAHVEGVPPPDRDKMLLESIYGDQNKC